MKTQLAIEISENGVNFAHIQDGDVLAVDVFLFKDKIVRKRSVTITPEKKKALKGKTIFSLKQNSCRFIIGDVDGLNTQYCCLPKKVRSYCDSHAEICYEKMRQKRGYKKEIKRRSGLVFTRPKNLAHIT